MNETVVKPDFRLDNTMIRVFDQEKTFDYQGGYQIELNEPLGQ